MNKVIRYLAPGIVFLSFLLFWEIAVRWFEIHKVVLPPPRDVLQSFIDERWVLLKGAWITLQAAAAGLMASGLIGFFVAVVFSLSTLIRNSFYPYVIFLQTVPIVAIAPLLILWFGNEFRTVVLVAAIISIFPVISNVTSGLLSINENFRDLFHLQSASTLQFLFKLRIPAAIPQFILGLRISCGLAVIGAIIGEFFVGDRGAYEGLGTIITARQANLRTSSMIAAVITCTLLGLVLLLLVQTLNKTIFRRWTHGVGFETEGNG